MTRLLGFCSPNGGAFYIPFPRELATEYLGFRVGFRVWYGIPRSVTLLVVRPSPFSTATTDTDDVEDAPAATTILL